MTKDSFSCRDPTNRPAAVCQKLVKELQKESELPMFAVESFPPGVVRVGKLIRVVACSLNDFAEVLRVCQPLALESPTRC
jgi:hypothetical protein